MMDRKMPALISRFDDLELVTIPKVTLNVYGEALTVDNLLRVSKDGHFHFFYSEIDEDDDRPSAESLYRESKIELPLMRINRRDILREDFMDYYLAKIRKLISRLGPGQPETPESRKFLETYREHGFRDKSDTVRAALRAFHQDIKQSALDRSADLYKEIYEDDPQSQAWVEDSTPSAEAGARLR